MGGQDCIVSRKLRTSGRAQLSRPRAAFVAVAAAAAAAAAPAAATLLGAMPTQRWSSPARLLLAPARRLAGRLPVPRLRRARLAFVQLSHCDLQPRARHLGCLAPTFLSLGATQAPEVSDRRGGVASRRRRHRFPPRRWTPEEGRLCFRPKGSALTPSRCPPSAARHVLSDPGCPPCLLAVCLCFVVGFSVPNRMRRPTRLHAQLSR